MTPIPTRYVILMLMLPVILLLVLFRPARAEREER